MLDLLASQLKVKPGFTVSVKVDKQTNVLILLFNVQCLRLFEDIGDEERELENSQLLSVQIEDGARLLVKKQ